MGVQVSVQVKDIDNEVGDRAFGEVGVEGIRLPSVDASVHGGVRPARY